MKWEYCELNTVDWGWRLDQAKLLNDGWQLFWIGKYQTHYRRRKLEGQLRNFVNRARARIGR